MDLATMTKPRTQPRMGPIAAGECLHSLVGKFLMRHPTIRDRLKEIQPLQCGVGVAGVWELIATGLQQEDNHLHAQQENNWAISQVDLTDAFDSVKRRLVLAEVAQEMSRGIQLV